MNKYLGKISTCAKVRNKIKAKLSRQEEENKELRSQIGAIWDNRHKEVELANLALKLSIGKSYVRGYQYALRDLKRQSRRYNYQYDVSRVPAAAIAQ